MKQSLQLTLGQHLTMTPQLQQAIKLLQMSTIEMQQEIQDALESNIMLEPEEDDFRSDDIQDSVPKKTEAEEMVSSNGSETNIPDELPIDTSWEDIYDSVQTLSTNLNPDRTEFESIVSKQGSLNDYLIEQLDLVSQSERDHTIAIFIIDSINDEGYFTSTVKEVWEVLSRQLEDFDQDEVQAVLNRIQSFEPVGVAAVDLVECLYLQLLQLPQATEFIDIAIKLVTKKLDLLVAQDKVKLMRELKISESQLNKVIILIRSLDPKPGLRIQSSQSEYVVPDVFVVLRNEEWIVDLNQDISPRLRINPVYQGMINRRDNSADNVSMKNHLQEARWFIKSLHSRNDTILRVAKCIVEKQQEFLKHGAISMKPMVLKDIAEELELHESTISRVTTQKYMHTPNGIFEFKYFFSSHVSTSAGGECSATAIRAFIKELVNDENQGKPLSDNKIANILNEKGINVARRTVAKYREAMSIPPSSQRKRIL
jgi:RNA polymerase sigma-54 factor